MSRTAANDIKKAVCEYLLSLNLDDKGFPLEHPFIPPTAINWIGDGLVKTVLPLVNTDQEAEVVLVDRFEAPVLVRLESTPHQRRGRGEGRWTARAPVARIGRSK